MVCLQSRIHAFFETVKGLDTNEVAKLLVDNLNLQSVIDPAHLRTFPKIDCRRTPFVGTQAHPDCPKRRRFLRPAVEFLPSYRQRQGA
jgi:hypothetical protein